MGIAGGNWILHAPINPVFSELLIAFEGIRLVPAAQDVGLLDQLAASTQDDGQFLLVSDPSAKLWT